MSDFEHILAKCQAAKRLGNTGPLSTGEALAAALVLNRADWLKEMDYTILQAIDRVGDDWMRQLPEVARYLRETS